MSKELPLSRDGYLDTQWFTDLAREIDKFAIKEGMKPTLIYFTPKVVPKYDKTKEKAGGDTWTKKRAQEVKIKKRAPAAGSRMRMVVQLRLYKGIEDPELGFSKDIKLALKAIEQHNKLAVRTVDHIKKAGAKLRERAAKDFDKNLVCFINDILKDGDGELLDGVDYSVGQSMMGKTLIVKLPNGGYVSIGKSDATKFENAQASAEDEEDEKPAKRKKKKNRD